MAGGSSPHLEFHLRWAGEALSVHGAYLKERQGEYAAELRVVLRGVDGVGKTVKNLSERNGFEIDYLVGMGGSDGVNQSSADVGKENLMIEMINGDDDEIEDQDEDGWIGLD